MTSPISAAEKERILSVSDLSVQRGGTQILRNVSWNIHRGEHWAILGSNGSGKTSLLLALTGYLMPTRGKIELLGEQFGQSDWRTLRERVGLVSASILQRIPIHELALDAVLSGRKAQLGNWGETSTEEIEQAENLLDQVRASHLADRPWRVLSQGERQRILIARALMADPALLILDEPCAGLDPVAREQFLHFLQQMAESPDAPSLIFVTHHVEEIIPAISHVLAMRAGRTFAAGEKEKDLQTDTLSSAFNAEVTLTSRNGKYQLQVSPDAHTLL
ncbi:MAG TPA: ABC transporter ATP-binding protein [Opitutales bacterium]|nr:ABC transporter ATP-binding protein [Opitutales bacterium]